MKNIRKSYLATLRRHIPSMRISCFQYRDDDYYHRHSFRLPNAKIGKPCFMAFWKDCRGQWEFFRMPLFANEHHLDLRRRFLDLPDPLLLWGFALHHHHRHPVRKATFQIGCCGTLSIRERYSIINRNLFNLNRTTKE